MTLHTLAVAVAVAMLQTLNRLAAHSKLARASLIFGVPLVLLFSSTPPSGDASWFLPTLEETLWLWVNGYIFMLAASLEAYFFSWMFRRSRWDVYLLASVSFTLIAWFLSIWVPASLSD